jgi:ribokinase
LRLHAIGFGSLNLDEFWEVTREFLEAHDLEPGAEYVRDVEWFTSVYPLLQSHGARKALEPGGSAANMIAALAGMGFETGFCGATGIDDTALLRLEELGEPENLRVTTLGVPAGRCLALIDKDDPGKDRSLVILPNANDLVGSYMPDMEYFQQAEWIHLTSFVSTGPLQAQIRLVENLSPTTRVSFDPGAVYCDMGLEAIRSILMRTDLLFVTSEELEKLTAARSIENGALALIEMGIPMIVVKMGADGIGLFVPGKFLFQPAVKPSEIKDRTGAGDVAAAGFLSGMLESAELEHCLFFAAAAASKSIEGYGRTAYPDENFFHRELSRIKNARRRTTEGAAQ